MLRTSIAVAGIVVAMGCTSTGPKPVVCNPSFCQSNEVFIQSERCAVPVQPGGSCSPILDVCTQGHACANGSCQSAPVILQPCQLGQPCAYAFGEGKPTYCKDMPACFPDSSLPPTCSVYVEIDQACDSAWLDPKCRPCTPGLNCTELGVCLKPCRTRADCPCDSQGVTRYGCVELAPERSFCRPCRSLGETCDATLPCCAEEEECKGGRCCRVTGAACTKSGECCGEDVCLNGTCTPCTPSGSGCATDAQCCTGNCQGGVCAIKCTQGAPCTVPGQDGICALGATNCTPTTKTCAQVVFPGQEVCNGLDDDCNGAVDDIPPLACSPATNLPSMCQNLTAAGTQKCQGSNLVCAAVQGIDYCTICGTNCGACSATPCVPGITKCIPNSVCAGAASMETCNYDPTCPHPTPNCWLPTDPAVPPNHCYSP